MTESRLDNRQSRQRDLLDQIAITGDKDLDALLRSIDAELAPPLRMTISGTHVVNISSVKSQNPETSKNRTIPPINNTIPLSFTGGNVTVPATNNNNITNDSGGPAVLLNIPNGDYTRMGIAINALGQLIVTLSATTDPTLANVPSPAAPASAYAIGHVVLFNNAGTIEDLQNEDFFQYLSSVPSSAENPIEEAIRNQLLVSQYKGATPIIFEESESEFVDPTSTGLFVLSTKTYDINAAEKFVSKQLLDANEFLGQDRDIFQADVTLFWNLNNVDETATYRISRDGGINWETLDMSRVGVGTTAYYGAHTFSDSYTTAQLDSGGSVSTTEEMNTTSSYRISQAFSNAASAVVKEVDLTLVKTGAPTGNLYIAIAKDNGGVPGDILTRSVAYPISGLVSGVETFEVPETVMVGGDTYHMIVETDATYKGSFVASTTSIGFSKDAASNGLSRSDAAGSWSDAGAEGLQYSADGRLLDLRVEVTGAGGGKIDGLGVFYDVKAGSVINGIKNFDRFDFKAVADNLSSFTLNFRPDLDLLDVYHVQEGQVWKYPQFQIQGQTVIFPTNFFNNGAVEQDQTLLFMQTKGSSFDNSDKNATLMAENHLGSLDPASDKSQAGRGIKIRNANGDLREISLDASDNIVISSLP